MKISDNEYTKLESIHCALQELRYKYNIPHDNEHLHVAFSFVEDLRAKHMSGKTVSIRDEKLNEDFYMLIRIGKTENFKEWLIENSKDISKGRYTFNKLTLEI